MADNKFTFFDIETGGFDPSGDRASSLLSASWQRGEEIVSSYSRPVKGSWLSEFSAKKILPQLEGKQAIPESETLRAFIQDLKASTQPVAGYNIQNFDLPFLHGRAAKYGLGGSLTEALRGKPIIDASYGVKDVISSAISTHAYQGTFDKRLGTDFRSLLDKAKEVPAGSLGPEFNAIHQAIGYDTARMYGKSAGSIQMQGWKLEDVYDILRKHGGADDLAGQAHESATDVLMTRKVFEAEQSGHLARVFQKPEVADYWLSQTTARRAETVAGSRGSGQFYQASRGLKEIWRDLPLSSKLATGIGAGLALTAGALAVNNLFSGRDDEYNTIEGLPHGGQGQTMRRALTPFGSGFKGSHAMQLEGMSHGGIAQLLRQKFTDFGSPVDLKKAALRASELYKDFIGKRLAAKGIDASKLQFVGGLSERTSSDIADLTFFVKDQQGKNLVSFSRTFNKSGVELENVAIHESLQGGLGKSFYEDELKVFREMGYEAGEKITSTVISPITGRMQATMYGAKPSPTTAWELTDFANEGDFMSQLVAKKVTYGTMPLVTMEGAIPAVVPDAVTRASMSLDLVRAKKIAQADLQKAALANAATAGRKGGRMAKE